MYFFNECITLEYLLEYASVSKTGLIFTNSITYWWNINKISNLDVRSPYIEAYVTLCDWVPYNPSRSIVLMRFNDKQNGVVQQGLPNLFFKWTQILTIWSVYACLILTGVHMTEKGEDQILEKGNKNNYTRL